MDENKYRLTESERRMLTEKVLGEKWKVPENITEVGTNYFPVNNRTFTTPDDFFALVKALQEMGKWHDFYWSVKIKWLDENPDEFNDADFTKWLLNPARLAWMVKEFMKEEEK